MVLSLKSAGHLTLIQYSQVPDIPSWPPSYYKTQRWPIWVSEGQGLLKVGWAWTPLWTRVHCHLPVLMSEANEVNPLHQTLAYQLLPCRSLGATHRQARAIFPLLLAAVTANICVGRWCAYWHAPLGQGVVRFLPSLGGKTGCHMVCLLLQPRQCGWRACVGRLGKAYKQETKISNSFQFWLCFRPGNVFVRSAFMLRKNQNPRLCGKYFNAILVRLKSCICFGRKVTRNIEFKNVFLKYVTKGCHGTDFCSG